MSSHREIINPPAIDDLGISSTIAEVVKQTESVISITDSTNKESKDKKGEFAGALEEFVKNVNSVDFTSFPIVTKEGTSIDMRNLVMRGLLTLKEEEKVYVLMSVLGGQPIDFRDPVQTAAVEEKRNEYALKISTLGFKKTMAYIGIAGAAIFAILIIGVFVWITTQKGVSGDTGGFLKGALDNVIEALKLIISI